MGLFHYPAATNETPLPLLSLVGLALIILVFLASRYWRLRHIPGPFLASLTNLWAAIRIWKGEYSHDFIKNLHARYGPVVRWGPNRVSFASPAAIPVIYGTQNVFPKAPSYSPLVIYSRGEEITTLITVRDEKRLSEMKRHISAGFSQSSWLKQEGQIDASLKCLVNRLEKEVGTEVELHRWIKYWGVDILTLLAFGESRDCLGHAADTDGIFPASKQRLSHWRTWSAMPTLEQLLFKNPIVQYFQRSSRGLAQLALKQIHLRQAHEKQAAGHDLLGRYLAASQQAPGVIRPRDVLALTISTINAGTDAVSLASISTIARLLSNSVLFGRIEQEISAAGLPIPAPFNELDRLPFLDAVIRENFRLSVNLNCTERTISPHGMTICDTYIPPGTDVSVSDILVARDASVFGEQPNSFLPQRWLDADERQFREMEKASFHFGFGRRECIGKHLARIEVKKCVATLIAAFKMELAEEPQRWFDGGLAYVNVKVKLQSRS